MGQDSPCLRTEKRGTQREAHSARVVASKCSRSCHPCACSRPAPVVLGCCSTRRFNKKDLKSDSLDRPPLYHMTRSHFYEITRVVTEAFSRTRPSKSKGIACKLAARSCRASVQRDIAASCSARLDHHVRLRKTAPLGASSRCLSFWLQLQVTRALVRGLAPGVKPAAPSSMGIKKYL